jgi:hypothetical protein
VNAKASVSVMMVTRVMSATAMRKAMSAIATI